MKKIKIGLVGLGVVGKSVYEILIKDKKIINAKSVNELELVAVSARSKKDFIDETKVRFFSDALDLARDPAIDVVVEVVGGEGIAREICETALKNGKKVVTANKALIAAQGFELAKIADENQSHIFLFSHFHIFVFNHKCSFFVFYDAFDSAISFSYIAISRGADH